MPVLVATASRLPAPEADEVLAPFAEATRSTWSPSRQHATWLPGWRAKAMWWSNRFRRAGFDEMCPLLRIVRDDTREPLFRLLAAAGGYLSFRTSASSRRRVKRSLPSVLKIAARQQNM